MPESWQGRRVVIHFGGTESVLYVYVNGHAIGLSKDSRLPSEFDLTASVGFGQKNLVTAVVVKWSDASFIKDQDQWWMGSLHREVYLYATGPVYLADIFARGNLNENYVDGQFAVTAKVGFPDQPEEGWMVEMQLYDPRGKSVFVKSLSSPVPVGSHGMVSRLHAEFDIPVTIDLQESRRESVW